MRNYRNIGATTSYLSALSSGKSQDSTISSDDLFSSKILTSNGTPVMWDGSFQYGQIDMNREALMDTSNNNYRTTPWFPVTPTTIYWKIGGDRLASQAKTASGTIYNTSNFNAVVGTIQTRSDQVMLRITYTLLGADIPKILKPY